jgi:hypothetical protein
MEQQNADDGEHHVVRSESSNRPGRSERQNGDQPREDIHNEYARRCETTSSLRGAPSTVETIRASTPREAL